MTALSNGIPMVLAGEGQDKTRSNNLVQYSGVGVRLGHRAPSVEVIKEGLFKVLDDPGYKQKAAEMGKIFDQYNFSQVFDRVIQSVVQDWAVRVGNMQA